MKIRIVVYDRCKYEYNSKVVWMDTQEITRFKVKQIPKEEILKETSSDSVDPLDEYLILEWSNGGNKYLSKQFC